MSKKGKRNKVGDYRGIPPKAYGQRLEKTKTHSAVCKICGNPVQTVVRVSETGKRKTVRICHEGEIK